jgi:hypothetical protein
LSSSPGIDKAITIRRSGERERGGRRNLRERPERKREREREEEEKQRTKKNIRFESKRVAHSARIKHKETVAFVAPCLVFSPTRTRKPLLRSSSILFLHLDEHSNREPRFPPSIFCRKTENNNKTIYSTKKTQPHTFSRRSYELSNLSTPTSFATTSKGGRRFCLVRARPLCSREGKKCFCLSLPFSATLFFFFFFSSRRHPLKTASLVFLFENSIFCGLVEKLLAPCSLCKQFR